MGRISWTDERTRKLLVILTDEKDRGVSKYSWPNVAKIFNVQTNLNVVGKQVQNHYGDLKEKFKCWEELQRMTGIAYNPVTKEVDVEEKCLPRWENFLARHNRYGLALAKKDLANIDLLEKLFGGQSAYGIGGTFSPSLGNKSSYLSPNVEDLTINQNEGSGDSEDNQQNVDVNTTLNMSAAESVSPSKAKAKKVAVTSTSKRKSEDAISSTELKRRAYSFDKVIELLSNSVVGPSSAPVNAPTKADRIRDELIRMEVPEKRGDDFFVDVLQYLMSDDRHADSFLAMVTDSQRWRILDKAPIG